MVKLCNKSYIEVETAFMSLMPNNVNLMTSHKLIEYYINKLKKYPELHDKIEFEISHNYFNPNIDERLVELEKVLDKKELINFRDDLKNLTKKIFREFRSIKETDDESIEILNSRRSEIEKKYQAQIFRKKLIILLICLTMRKNLELFSFLEQQD